MNQAFIVKFLQQNTIKVTNKVRDLLGPRNMSNGHWTGGNLSFGLESKFEIFGSNRIVFVRRRVGEQIISAFVVPTVKHGRGVMLCLLVTMTVIYLEHQHLCCWTISDGQ